VGPVQYVRQAMRSKLRSLPSGSACWQRRRPKRTASGVRPERAQNGGRSAESSGREQKWIGGPIRASIRAQGVRSAESEGGEPDRPAAGATT